MQHQNEGAVAHQVPPAPRQFQQRVSAEVQLAQEARLVTLVFVPYLHGQFNIRALFACFFSISRSFGAAVIMVLPLAIFVRPTSAFFVELVGLFWCQEGQLERARLPHGTNGVVDGWRSAYFLLAFGPHHHAERVQQPEAICPRQPCAVSDL